MFFAWLLYTRDRVTLAGSRKKEVVSIFKKRNDADASVFGDSWYMMSGNMHPTHHAKMINSLTCGNYGSKVTIAFVVCHCCDRNSGDKAALPDAHLSRQKKTETKQRTSWKQETSRALVNTSMLSQQGVTSDFHPKEPCSLPVWSVCKKGCLDEVVN